MTTQEKNKAIAEWLGLEIQGLSPNEVSIKNPIGEPFSVFWKPDKDCNQQRLIEDKLVEIGYHIKYEYQGTWIVLISEIYKKYAIKENKSKDTAFIDAVIELIKLK